jgi:hypothetical protein
MKRAFLSLPGPMGVKVILAAIILVVGLVVLFFVYDWMGNTLLDSGGTIS